MSTADVRRGRGQAVAGALIVLVLVSLPGLGIVAAASTGSVGSIGMNTFRIVNFVTNVAMATGAGWVLRRAYILDPDRRAGEVWSTFYGGLVVVVLGFWLVPLLMVFTLVDSDHSLQQHGPLVFVAWFVLHAAVAGLGLLAARGLLRPAPDDVPLPG